MSEVTDTTNCKVDIDWNNVTHPGVLTITDNDNKTCIQIQVRQHIYYKVSSFMYLENTAIRFKSTTKS